MQTISTSGAEAPPLFIRANSVRRRVAVSDALAAVLAALAYPCEARDQIGLLAALTADRTASARVRP